MPEARYGRLLRAVVDLIATAIESSSPRISDERLRELLGPSPVLPQYLGETKSQSPLPPDKQESYCYECATQHLGLARVTLREALERFDRGGQNVPEIVKEKLRKAYEELLGAEDDLRAISDKRTLELHNKVEDIRKWLYRSGVLVNPTREAVAQALSKVSEVSDEVYRELEARRDKLLNFIRQAKERLSQLERRLAEGETREKA
jgi:hypothetical protein